MDKLKKYLVIICSGLAFISTVFAASKAVVLKPEFNTAMQTLVKYIDARFDRLERRIEKRYDNLDEKIDKVIERQINKGD